MRNSLEKRGRRQYEHRLPPIESKARIVATTVIKKKGKEFRPSIPLDSLLLTRYYLFTSLFMQSNE
jgi:hypothetical protein